VLNLDEAQVRAAAQRLGQIGFARLASGPGSRTAKYRHLLDESLGLDRAETAVLAVLLLRGAQTPAELKARTERLGGVGDIDEVLARLDERDVAHLLPRQPGQREERWIHLLGEIALDVPAETGTRSPDSIEARLQRLEERLGELERLLAERGLLD